MRESGFLLATRRTIAKEKFHPTKLRNFSWEIFSVSAQMSNNEAKTLFYVFLVQVHIIIRFYVLRACF